MIERKLTVSDFREYFEKNKLGRLTLPNGNWGNGMSLKLNELFKLMSGWKIKNESEVPFDDILAVVVYGSAIRYPGYEMISVTAPKYLGLFGQEVEVGAKKRFISPNDVDFFVLTEKDITRDRYIAPGLHTTDFGSGGCITSVTKAGINLVNRGVSQLLNGINQGDTISISAMKEGIPVFYNGRLEEVQEKSGIVRENKRKLLWDEDEEATLVGRIE